MKLTKKQLKRIIKEELLKESAEEAREDISTIDAQRRIASGAYNYGDVAEALRMLADEFEQAGVRADEKAAKEILSTRAGSYKGTTLPGGKKIQ